MIQYMITTYKADPKNGFVTGSSSGGMMTNVISAVYPDVIAAGPAYSGVAAGCLAGRPGFGPVTANLDCANGKKIVKTRESWVAQVKTFYPGYNGTYPRMQVWHRTADALVFYPNLGEEIKKWSGLDDVTWTKNLTTMPQGGYTLMVYGDGTKFTAYSAVGVGHTVPVHQDLDLKWFALHKLDSGVAQI
jgi:acetylxylan esterase